MGSLIGWLAARGLGESMARAVAIGGLFALLLAVMGSLKCAYDARLIRAHDHARDVAIARRVAPASDAAAEARAADIIAISTSEGENHAAISRAPDGAPSAAAVALACQRLRRAGTDVADHPACR